MISNLKTQVLSSLGAVRRASELCEFASSLKSEDLALCGELCVSGYERLDRMFWLDLDENLANFLKSGAYLGYSCEFDGYNEFRLLGSNGLEFKQRKYKLFKPNGENKIFKFGNLDEISIREIAGIKVGVLICFELRFIDLWSRLRGADVILVPAMWGQSRREHYETLCKALALQNRCYTLACSDVDLKFSAVFAPDGSKADVAKFDINLIKKFRKMDR
ncbi:carbon-nitrogen hydrolase family protein [Campylobacter devanensis]|uniref:carbon-nitrogen hydrolase family protein n=1 Tax=Campylobacter devanensis TaxID=3161138 RepID=UPI000A344AC3|nr:carbon-nitrogen hydrolase family protein [Campylobacter sp. P0209]